MSLCSCMHTCARTHTLESTFTYTLLHFQIFEGLWAPPTGSHRLRLSQSRAGLLDYFISFFFTVLGFKLRAPHILGKCCIKSHSQPLVQGFLIFWPCNRLWSPPGHSPQEPLLLWDEAFPLAFLPRIRCHGWGCILPGNAPIRTAEA